MKEKTIPDTHLIHHPVQMQLMTLAWRTIAMKDNECAFDFS
jgi:hypothetical protein